MFCEKCGYKNNDTAKFCERCGATLNAAPAQPAEAQPAEAQPVQPAPKKPMSPKTKKLLVIGSVAAAVAVVGLIVLFAAVIPAIRDSKKVDLTKYYVLRFDGVSEYNEHPSLPEGKISGTFEWDYETFAKDQKMSSSDAHTLLYGVGSDVTIRYTYGSQSETYSSNFYDLSSGDSIVVSYEWPKEQKGGLQIGMGSLDYIKMYEKEYGVEFRHEDKFVTYKLADELKAKNITVEAPVEADLLRYISDNNLIVEDGKESGKASVSVKPFETKFGDYTFKLQKDSLTVVVVDKNHIETGSVVLVFSDRENLKNGDKIELGYDTYDREYLAEKGVILRGDTITYTVKAPEPTTVAPTTEPVTTEPTSTVPDTTAAETTAPAAEEYQEAYVRHAGDHDVYYLFDTVNRRFISFATNDPAVKEGTYTGEFDDGAALHIQKPAEASETFTHKDGAKTASVTAEDGTKTEPEVCDLATALEALKKHQGQ